MRIRHFAISVACAGGLLLSACGSSDAPNDAAAPDTSTQKPATSSQSDPLAHVTSCDQVATLVAPHIEALVLTATSTVDQWGVSCQWEAAENETDMANNRIVSVHAVANEPGTEAPVLEGVLKMDGSQQLEDPWLAEHDAIAYTVTTTTAVAATTVTTVWRPDVEVTVGGGRWANIPALDGPASLRVAQELLSH